VGRPIQSYNKGPKAVDQTSAVNRFGEKRPVRERISGQMPGSKRPTGYKPRKQWEISPARPSGERVFGRAWLTKPNPDPTFSTCNELIFLSQPWEPVGRFIRVRPTIAKRMRADRPRRGSLSRSVTREFPFAERAIAPFSARVRHLGAQLLARAATCFFSDILNQDILQRRVGCKQ
jgi:hypothetical protein